jgi:serine/threonine-protein kinase
MEQPWQTTPCDVVSRSGISRSHLRRSTTHHAKSLYAFVPPLTAYGNDLLNQYRGSLRSRLEDLPQERCWMGTDDKREDTPCGETQREGAFLVLKERYQVVQFIARGGMATIYRGLDLQWNRTVALKILHQTTPVGSAAGSLLQEARMTSLVHHPQSVQVYDSGQQEDLCFLVLEWIEGRSLYQELQTKHILSVKRALTIAHAVARALGAAHDCGIVHLDVKPFNIMLGPHDEITLIDFGIAIHYQEEQISSDAGDVVVGTPQYLAPEQAQGTPLSPATDVYALGVVLYEMLLGRRPFLSEKSEILAAQHAWLCPPAPSQLQPTLAPALEAILMCCLEKEPQKRFENGNALAQALLVHVEDAAEYPLSSLREERQAPGCNGDAALITAPRAAGISFPRAFQVGALLGGFILLIALGISLVLYVL